MANLEPSRLKIIKKNGDIQTYARSSLVLTMITMIVVGESRWCNGGSGRTMIVDFLLLIVDC